MDFAIDTTTQPADMTFTQVGDIGNNIHLSLAIVRGSWWFNPDFGMRDTRRLKNTAQTARLVESYAKEALQWLLDTGRATAIAVASERDVIQDPHRLKLLIQVTQANGRQLTFTTFKEVV